MKNFTKVIIFIISYVFLLTVAVLSFVGIPEGGSETREVIQTTLVELAGLLISVAFYKFVFSRRVQAAAQYKFKLPESKVIFGIFLVYPLICFIKVLIIGLSRSPEYLWLADKDFTWEGLKGMPSYIPVEVIIGPLFEEMCCRVLPLSAYTSKHGKIISGICTALLFSLIHISSWATVMPSAIMFTVVFLVSGNMALSMFMHIANNFSTFLIPILSGAYVLSFPETEMGVMGLPIPILILFVLMFILGGYFIITALLKNSTKAFGK